MIPASYGHLADHCWGHHAPNYFVRTVFPFALAGTTKSSKRLPAEKPRFAPGSGGGGYHHDKRKTNASHWNPSPSDLYKMRSFRPDQP